MGAARVRRHNRSALRYPRNADIEEAAESEPDEEGKERKHSALSIQHSAREGHLLVLGTRQLAVSVLPFGFGGLMRKP